MPTKPGNIATAMRRWQRLALKELREILRDRRTIVTLVLMPMLVYPLIGMTFQKFLAAQLTQSPQVEYRLGYRDQLSAQTIGPLWQVDEKAQADVSKGTDDNPELKQIAPTHAGETFDLPVLIKERVIDLGISTTIDEQGIAQVELITEDGSHLGRNARQFVERRLQAVIDDFYQAELQRLDSRLHAPLVVSQTRLPAQGGSGVSLAVLVPLILILMTVTGAVYPAIDLTAGERERGTLEALISSPVPRQELLFAKYLAVLTIAILTAITNLFAMTVTAYITGLESLLFGSGGLTLSIMLKVLGVLVVFAGFFSALLLVVTSFARSFKEAQAYLIPVMLVSIAPGILSLMPGLELTWGLSLTPLANMVLVTRDLFEDQPLGLTAVVAFVSTVIYAVISLMWAAKIFGTDAVLYGSSGSWSDLWQRPEESRAGPGAVQVLSCLAVVLPLFLLCGRWLASWVETDLNVWLIGQVGLTTALFVGLPLIWSWWQRVSPSITFTLRPAPLWAFGAAALAGLSLWPFAYEALLWALPSEQIQALMKKFASVEARLTSIPYAARLVVFAIVPAITEEFFFRGYLLQGLARDWGRWRAIVISSAVFGLFHVFVQGLSFERFIPTALLGICLGWVFVRSGSVWPGMLLHVLHNSFLISLSEYKEQLHSAGIGVEQQAHLPLLWLIVAGIMVGTASLIFSRIRPTSLPLPEPIR